jgi:hypothetical protein
MTDSDSTSIEGETTSSADYRQIAFVTLAALALILTAFVVPPVANSGSGFSVGSGNGRNGPGSSANVDAPGSPNGGLFDLPNFSFNWGDLFSWVSSDDSNSTSQEPSSPAKQCSVSLVGDIVPGNRVVAVVRYKGQLLSDAPVWFNDRQIGYTDEMGRVGGEVPYTETLRVRVGLPSDTNCVFVKNEVRSSVALAGTGRLGSLGATELSLSATADKTGSNATVEYEVDGTVNLSVEGKPFPGETVTIVASIEGTPMRQATVEIDGDPVAQTDENGRATVRVPDDGSERFEVRVSRGDFSGTTTVDILLLEVSLRPTGLVVIPGTTAIVETRLADKPVENAVVTVDGERVGTTGPDGTLAVELPFDPTATVTVSTDEQTASTSVAAMYRIVLPLFALVVAALAAVAYRRRGVRGAVAVLAVVGAGLAVVIIDAVWGRAAGFAAVIALIFVVAIVTVAMLIRRRRAAGTATGSLLASAAEWIVGAALQITRKLARVIAWARALLKRVRRWLRSFFRSIPERLNRFAAWILAVFERSPLATIAVAVVCATGLAVGYAVAGIRGFVAVVVALVLALAVRQYLRRDGDESDTTTESSPTDSASSAMAGDETANGATERPSFRELWRAFARQIDPPRWRTRTPGEIARAAIDQGYPAGPVHELTTLFREVEYGDRLCSETVHERAEDAYGTIEADPQAEGGERS